MDIPATKPRYLKSAANLKSARQKAREVLAMSMSAALTPVGSRLKTQEGSISDISDCGSQGSEYGYSVLHEAVISHDLEYLDYLLKAGCDLEQRDENGFTALHVATLEKSVDAVDRLVNAGSNVASLTKEGMSSLHIAVEIQDNDKVLTLLTDSNSNIDIRNKVGRTSLHLAARCGSLGYLKILLDAGCHREIKDKFGMKPVDAAKARNHEECVQFLLHYLPQKRNLRTSVDERNSEKHPPDNERTLVSNCGYNNQKDNNAAKWKKQETGSLSSNRKSGIIMCDEELKVEQHERENDQCNLTLPGTLTCEMDYGKVAGKVAVLQEEPKESQLQFCTTFDGQSKNPKDGIVEQESRENVVGHNKLPIDFNLNEVESFEETKTQVDRKKEEVNGNGLEMLGKGFKEMEDVVLNEQLYFLNRNKNGISETVLLSSAILINGGKERSINKCLPSFASFSNDEVPSEIPSKLNLPHISIKVVENISNKNHGVLLHKIFPRAIDSKELLKVITRLSEPKLNQEEQINIKMTLADLCQCREESTVLLAMIPLPLFGVRFKDEDFLHPLRLCRFVMNGRAINGLKTADHDSSDIVSKVLEDLKKSIYDTRCTRKNLPLQVDEQKHCQVSPQDCEKLRSKINVCDRENAVELFIKACRALETRPAFAYELLEEVCDIVCSKDNTELKRLAEHICTCSNLSTCAIISNDVPITTEQNISHTDLDSFLLALAYVLRQDNTPVLFVSAVLEFIITHQECMIAVATTRPEFIELALTKTMSSDEAILDVDKLAEIFVLLCTILEDDMPLLCRYVDILLGQALSRCDIDNMGLSSCILVRMGLLKSESTTRTISKLREPLMALKHVFAQEYFPRSLASLFVSFLAKPSPRFAKLKDLHSQTLESAIIKEILPQSNDLDASVLGKGLKRICDILAHGEYWETAYHCCDILFEKAFGSTRCSPMGLGQSILIYFGLIKSEVRLETIKDVKNGLKLLQHACTANRIPQSIAPMLVVFLNKDLESKRLEPYKVEVDCLVKLLMKEVC